MRARAHLGPPGSGEITVFLELSFLGTHSERFCNRCGILRFSRDERRILVFLIF
jgi:hypothetical protein